MLAAALLCGADAFSMVGARPALAVNRAAPVDMQFFNPKKDAAPPKDAKKSKRGGGRDFYDDEKTSYNTNLWQPNFVENGEEDLATVGGVYYLAFVPFLLFGISYLFGAIGSPYGKGNF